MVIPIVYKPLCLEMKIKSVMSNLFISQEAFRGRKVMSQNLCGFFHQDLTWMNSLSLQRAAVCLLVLKTNINYVWMACHLTFSMLCDYTLPLEISHTVIDPDLHFVWLLIDSHSYFLPQSVLNVLPTQLPSQTSLLHMQLPLFNQGTD